MIKPKIQILHKFNNLLIKKGKKAKANTLMLNTFFNVKRKTKQNPINLVHSVLKFLTPGITTKKTVIAGRLYHLPNFITKNKSVYFSCKWLQQAAMENKEIKQKTLDFKLAEECFKVLKKKGQSLIFLKQHNKMVSENRPFLRFVRRKFRPRLPHKVWLRRKKMLWLSRRKKVRRNYIDNFDYQFKITRVSKIVLNKKKKYASKTLRNMSKLLKVQKSRTSRLLVKKAKKNSILDRKRNPEKFRRLELIRKRIINKRKNAKKNKRKHKRNAYKTTNYKNRFQSRT